MYEPQLIKRTSQNYKQVTPPLPESNQEEEALLLVINASIHELNQPLTVVMGLTELLLGQAEPGSALAADLAIIVKETQRIHEIIRGLKLLGHYQTLL